jgi:transcriptional regulator with XRE-family HTH domain
MPHHDGRVPQPLSALLARNVAAERVRRRWTQAELAGALGVSRATLSGWEAGSRQIGVDWLLPLCGALDVPLVKLLDGLDGPNLQRLGL